MKSLLLLLIITLINSSGSFTFNPIKHTFRPKPAFTRQNTFLQNKNDNNMQETILIVGGGFGGLYTALTLSTLLKSISSLPSTSTLKIKLIDSKERFIFLPLLYELCIDKIPLDEVAPTYKDLLTGSGIEFIQGDVTGVDVDLHSVSITNSSMTSGKDVVQGDACIKYDKLVIATGNSPPTVDKLESRLNGASDCLSSLCTFYTIDDCYDLRRRLTYLQRLDKANVVIVGGGYSGVELACNILADDSENRLNVTLLHKGGSILPDAAVYNRENAMKQLKKLGATVMTDTIVSKVSNCTDVDTAYPPCMVHTQSNDQEYELQADLLIWTAGGGGGSATIVSSLTPHNMTKDQKIIVTSNLNANNDIYALGDIAQLSKSTPQTAQKAIQQAYTVAWNVFSEHVNTNILSKLNKKKLLPISSNLLPPLPKVQFEYFELGEILTLGTKDATVSTLGGLVQVDGAAGGIARRLIYSLRMPTWMQALMSTVGNLNRFFLLGLLDK